MLFLFHLNAYSFSLNSEVANNVASEASETEVDFYEESSRSSEDFVGYSFYFTVGERLRSFIEGEEEVNFTSESFLPGQVFRQALRQTIRAISLLQWNKVNKSLSLPKEKYNRSYHFGTWIQDPREKSCLNTRQRILYSASTVEPQFKEDRCVVDRGEWYDQYTGTTFRRAMDIQVDHVVPLKNAFISGAWRWSKRQRCVYTNFLGNDFHLLPVSGLENMRKSDRTPANYLPPREGYRCEYLKNWLMIKLVWKLAINPTEAEAIESEIHRLGCSFDDFNIHMKVLQEQRRRAQADLAMCPI